MRLRTFLAKDMKEALCAMRAELGDEAIIVASEKLKDGSVLLRAGLEETQALARASEEALARDPPVETTGTASGLPAFEARYRDGLLARLRGPKPNGASRAIGFDRAALMEILRAHRTPDALAERLAADAEESGLPDMVLALASALDKSMRIEPIDAGHRGAILLAGPPGAGKTVIAAKLAAQNCLAGCPVVLAATDLDTAGQVARLETFAACLNLTVVRASTPDALSEAAREAHLGGALLIADSGACDPRGALTRELLGFLSLSGLTVVGVMSATVDAEDAGEIAAGLAKLGATRLIVTGLDLARRKGALVALALSGLAIAQVTASAYLADGLETLTPMALSRMLLAEIPSGDVQRAAAGRKPVPPIPRMDGGPAKP